jgi:SAM-dependent methyltransferase
MANFNPLNHPICLAEPLRLAPTGWAGHVPFAMFLVDVLRPRTIVELGTYTGVSYCAFCQAVKALRTDSRCFAVDTWEGDEQTDFYGAEILEELQSHHDPLYGSFSSLIQSDFDEALSRFGDGTIDLLHIDGYHSYEAVKHDFETWLPKMSERGVVLLHDTQVRDAGFGVWKFWAEVRQSYPHFEFTHEHGLGVAAVGTSLNEELRQLMEASADEAAPVREFFHQLGKRLSVRVMMQRELEAEGRKHAGELLAELQRRQAEHDALASLFEDRDKRLNDILNSRAWRWVTRYGHLKNRYFTPVHRTFRSPRNQISVPASCASSSQPESGLKLQTYERRITQEVDYFKGIEDIHELPESYHYWSGKYLQPKFASLGFADPNDFFLQHIERAASAAPEAECNILSVGAGNCDTEVTLAEMLSQKGIKNFSFGCLDLNAEMLSRGRRLAGERGLSDNFEFLETDINSWQSERRYQIILANQSLHHFVELEVLFDKIYRGLTDDGFFITHDMIGRNGHMLWPEALEQIKRLWLLLEDRHKWNQQLNRFEEQYQDWDCSVSGFEGIRAQDILPLLLRKFKFQCFLGFANLILVFVGRNFGSNFDVSNEFDRSFIDFVAAMDDYYIESGRLKPVQMIAAMTRREAGEIKVYKHLTPEFCVRHVGL